MLREIGTFLPCDLSTFSQIEEFRLEELSPTMQHEVILGSERGSAMNYEGLMIDWR